MSLTLELNCIVLGDDPSHAFVIDIVDNKKVSALKKAIKDVKKSAFDHVPADHLKIFMVSLPVDDSLDDKLKSFHPEDEGDRRLSNAMERLKEVFEHPTDGHLHVIVLAPPAGE
jgi:hypothetical protein